jgi:uncharacterized phage protein (TIGR02218 family)
MLPAAVSLSDGFDAEASEVAGALTAAAISESDLRAGRWDRAVVRLFMVDWCDPGGEQVALAQGELGDVSFKGNGFEAEMRGRMALLDAPVVEQTSPECRADLGDRRCRVDMAGRVLVTRITAIVSETEIDVAEASAEPNAYGYGRLRWIRGANSGLDSALLASDGLRLTLREEPPFAPVVGDLVEIREGCDRRFATCTGRFANAENFRGEPHLPGMDLLTRYPGA